MLGMARFTLKNYAESENRLRVFLQRDLAHDDRNFKRAGHLVDRNVRSRRKRPQFGERMIDQPLDIRAVEQTGHDREMLFAFSGAGARRSELGHQAVWLVKACVRAWSAWFRDTS